MRVCDLRYKLGIEWCSCNKPNMEDMMEAKYITEYMPQRFTITGSNCQKKSECEAAIVHEKGNKFKKTYKLDGKLLAALMILTPNGHSEVKLFLEKWGHGRKCTKP